MTCKKVYINVNHRKKIRTFWNVDERIISIISNETGDPCIKIVVASSYAVDRKVSTFICSTPKLVALIIFKWSANNIPFLEKEIK